MQSLPGYMMKPLIVINALIFGAILVGALFLADDKVIRIGLAAGIAVCFISGALTSWLWYKRGKIYEERGQSGPDD